MPTAVDPLQPWPDTVQWRPVSRKLVTVQLIGLAVWQVILLTGLGVAWLFLHHWGWLAGMAAVLLLGVWRATVAVRAVRAWGYAERDNDLMVRHGLLVRRLS